MTTPPLVLTSQSDVRPSNFGQTGFEFPQPLTEKYRPGQIAEFVGLDKVKRAMSKLAANPYPSAWFFLGNSGTGKTTMALALAAEMPAELHHIASKECTLETVQDISRKCHWMPRMFDDWKPCKMHVVLIDEADQMSYPAQLAFLSLLDSTAFPPNTIFIFTGNDTANLEARFMSRVRLLEFSSYGISKDVTDLLQRVWMRETDNPVETPSMANDDQSATPVPFGNNKIEVFKGPSSADPRQGKLRDCRGQVDRH